MNGDKVAYYVQLFILTLILIGLGFFFAYAGIDTNMGVAGLTDCPYGTKQASGYVNGQYTVLCIED